MSAPDLGFGVTVTFASGFIAKSRDMDWSGLSRESVDASHNDLAAALEFKPGPLYDPGELNVQLLFDPDTFPPINEDPETITVTFPLPDGATTAADWQAQGFLTNAKQALPYRGMMIQDVTIKFTGAITPTASA